MRAQFVRGIDPKDSMDIGNKYAREAQKLIATFKEIDPTLEPKKTDEQITETGEAVAVSVFSGTKTFSLIWIKSGLEYYMAYWSPKEGEVGGEDTFPKLEQAKQKMKEYLIINEAKKI
jgi:hypothetical protein